jgi:hypothetical protein
MFWLRRLTFSKPAVSFSRGVQHLSASCFDGLDHAAIYWLIDELGSERVPTIDFAHADLAGGEQCPKQQCATLSSSSHFPVKVYSNCVKPVALPPGPCQAFDKAGSNRIGDGHEYDRHSPGRL